MADKCYTSIGKLRKAFGVNGEIKTKIESSYLQDFLDSQKVFLKINGNYIPFFIEAIRETNSILVKLEDVDSPQETTSLTGHELFLANDDVMSDGPPDTKLQYGHLKGYQILNIDGQMIGKIIEIQSFPEQELALVEKASKKYFIPLNDTFIIDIDKDNHALKLDIPEGLMNIEQ